jgi:hypothetical protein
MHQVAERADLQQQQPDAQMQAQEDDQKVLHVDMLDTFGSDWYRLPALRALQAWG